MRAQLFMDLFSRKKSRPHFFCFLVLAYFIGKRTQTLSTFSKETQNPLMFEKRHTYLNFLTETVSFNGNYNFNV